LALIAREVIGEFERSVSRARPQLCLAIKMATDGSKPARRRFRPRSAGSRNSINGPDLAAIGKAVRIRETADKTTTGTAHYLLSTVLSPERFNQVVRQHWSVENCLHWRLDEVMNEDQDRTRMGNGPHKLAVLRHVALNATHKEGSIGSMRGKFKRAGWDDDYLIRLLEMF
jgi:predicted transposase YbfD/YdcC